MKVPSRRRYLLLPIIVLLGSCILGETFFSRPDHGPSQHMLAMPIIFPTTWGHDAEQIIGVEWEEGPLEIGAANLELTQPAFESYWLSDRLWNVGNSWRARNAGSIPYISQDLKQPLTLAEALVKYRTLGPGDSTTWGDISFRGAINTSPLVPHGPTLAATPASSGLCAQSGRSMRVNCGMPGSGMGSISPK